jgi:hypothetical protein
MVFLFFSTVINLNTASHMPNGRMISPSTVSDTAPILSHGHPFVRDVMSHLTSGKNHLSRRYAPTRGADENSGEVALCEEQTEQRSICLPYLEQKRQMMCVKLRPFRLDFRRQCCALQERTKSDPNRSGQAHHGRAQGYP